MSEVSNPSSSEPTTQPPEPSRPNEPAGTNPPPQKPLPPANGSNRTFWLAVSVLGAVFFFTLAVMATYVLAVRPQNTSQKSTQLAELNLQGTATLMSAFRTTATALALTKEANALLIAATPVVQATPQPPTATATLIPATATPKTGNITTGSKTSSSSAAQGAATSTATPFPSPQPPPLQTPTALPETGYGERAGLPGLFGLALFSLTTMIVARWIRHRG